jgi:hypothetical protein
MCKDGISIDMKPEVVKHKSDFVVGGNCPKGALISTQCQGEHDNEHGKASLDNMVTKQNGNEVS